ncbi:MAG: glycoside hydrolase family 15 protein [Candidatus Altimarinota bacterium]
MSKQLHIEKYGLIGDLESCALVGENGSIDWICWPRTDSPSVFGGLLAQRRGGHFSVNPEQINSKGCLSEQKYWPNSNILQTNFESKEARAKLIDLMVPKTVNAEKILIRKLFVTEGRMDFCLSFSPKFNYGKADADFEIGKDFVKVTSKAKRGVKNLQLQIKGSWQSEMKLVAGKIQAEFSLQAGETVVFILSESGGVEMAEELISKTNEYWTEWILKDKFQKILKNLSEVDQALMTRSVLALKLLRQEKNGAISAAASASLPEKLGGERNWDYRFNWVRDTALTCCTWTKIGFEEEAMVSMRTLMNNCRHLPDKMQPIYGLGGERKLKEYVLKNWSGYENSKPVRIGNHAYLQKQIDIFGEVALALSELTKAGCELNKAELRFLEKMADCVAANWWQKDAGIWEVRGEEKDFLHSKLMCWVALEKSVEMLKIKSEIPKKLAEKINYWSLEKEKIRQVILEKGYDEELGSFVQAFDNRVLDAAALQLYLLKFLDRADSQIQNTIKKIEEGLTYKNGLVKRYKVKEVDDGFDENEGAFLLCSFWLMEIFQLEGRANKAEEMLKNILGTAGSLGLLSEEIDIKNNRLIGNYPQAYSQIGLINYLLTKQKN